MYTVRSEILGRFNTSSTSRTTISFMFGCSVNKLCKNVTHVDATFLIGSPYKT